MQADQIKSAEFGVAATAAAEVADANNNAQDDTYLEEPSEDKIMLATTAEPYWNKPKGKRDSETHENIGFRVAAQEREHAS